VPPVRRGATAPQSQPTSQRTADAPWLYAQKVNQAVVPVAERATVPCDDLQPPPCARQENRTRIVIAPGLTAWWTRRHAGAGLFGYVFHLALQSLYLCGLYSNSTRAPAEPSATADREPRS